MLKKPRRPLPPVPVENEFLYVKLKPVKREAVEKPKEGQVEVDTKVRRWTNRESHTDLVMCAHHLAMLKN